MQPSGHGYRGAPAEGSHNTLFLSLQTVKKEDCVKAVGHRFREPARRNRHGDAMFITSHQEKRHVVTSPEKRGRWSEYRKSPQYGSGMDSSEIQYHCRKTLLSVSLNDSRNARGTDSTIIRCQREYGSHALTLLHSASSRKLMMSRGREKKHERG